MRSDSRHPLSLLFLTSVLFLGLAILALTGCGAATTSFPIETVATRDSTYVRHVQATWFEVQDSLASSDQDINLILKQRYQNETKFQRKFNLRRRINAKFVWGAVAVMIGGGAYIMTNSSDDALGRDIVGLSGLIPIGADMIFSRFSRMDVEWRDESSFQVSLIDTLSFASVVVMIGQSVEEIFTDSSGMLLVKIPERPLQEFDGDSLAISIYLRADSATRISFNIPSQGLGEDAIEAVLVYIEDEGDLEDATVSPATISPPIFVAPLPIEPAAPPELLVTEEIFADPLPPTLAIFESAAPDVSTPDRRFLRKTLETEVQKLQSLEIIDADQLRSDFEAAGTSADDCLTVDCAVDNGRLQGYKYVLLARFGKDGPIYSVDMHFITIGTGTFARYLVHGNQREVVIAIQNRLDEVAKNTIGIR